MSKFLWPARTCGTAANDKNVELLGLELVQQVLARWQLLADEQLGSGGVLLGPIVHKAHAQRHGIDTGYTHAESGRKLGRTPQGCHFGRDVKEELRTK